MDRLGLLLGLGAGNEELFVHEMSCAQQPLPFYKSCQRRSCNRSDDGYHCDGHHQLNQRQSRLATPSRFGVAHGDHFFQHPAGVVLVFPRLTVNVSVVHPESAVCDDEAAVAVAVNPVAPASVMAIV